MIWNVEPNFETALKITINEYTCETVSILKNKNEDDMKIKSVPFSYRLNSQVGFATYITWYG